jgi:hypothetical protein
MWNRLPVKVVTVESAEGRVLERLSRLLFNVHLNKGRKILVYLSLAWTKARLGVILLHHIHRQQLIISIPAKDCLFEPHSSLYIFLHPNLQ